LFYPFTFIHLADAFIQTNNKTAICKCYDPSQFNLTQYLYYYYFFKDNRYTIEDKVLVLNGSSVAKKDFSHSLKTWTQPLWLSWADHYIIMEQVRERDLVPF